MNKISNSLFEVSFLSVDGSICINFPEDFKLSGQSISIGFSRSITFPDFTKRISFLTGVKGNVYQYDEYFKKIGVSESNYLEFNNTFFSVSVQEMVCLHIINTPSFNLDLMAGIEAVKMFEQETLIRNENIKEDVVKTEFHTIYVDKRILFYQTDQIVLGFPNLCKSLQIGAGGKIPLYKPGSNFNTFGIDRSVQFTIYYKF